MSYTATLLIVVLVTAASVVATSLVRHVLGLDTRQRHHEVGNPIYLQIGVVFAVLLAFVFNEVWGEYNAAAQAINGECGALHGAAMLAHDLPDGKGKPVEQAILDYANTVINVEWPALEHRDVSPDAVHAFQAIVEAAGHLNLTDAAGSGIQGQMLDLLAQAHAQRETRIFQAGQGLPLVIWLVLSFYALVLVVFVMFAGVESRIGHLIFSAVFTASVVLVLMVLRLFDYPFEGALKLNASDFVRVIENVKPLIGAS